MILILILIIYLLYYNYKSKYNKIKPYLISKSHKNLLLKTLTNTHNIFEKHDIFYVIEGGILLGAVRDKSIIPWDDDADLLVLLKDKNKILNLKNEFIKLGHDIKQLDRLLRIYCIKGKKYPFIDLFINDTITNIKPKYNKFVKNNDLIRCTCTFKPSKFKCIDNCCVYPKNVKWWWKYNFKLNDLLPRKKYKLNEITLYGPNNPYPYIFTWYGINALNTYMFTHNHKSNKKKQNKIILTKEEYKKLHKYFFPN
jgi:phosphorylcholine metabolism protein LicD